MDFWTGRVVLGYGDVKEFSEGRVFIDDDFDLKIEVTNTLGLEAFLLVQREDIAITVPALKNPVPALFSHSKTLESGQGVLVFTPKRSPIWKPASAPLIRGRASLLNFSGFEVGPYSRARIELSACGWDITLIPVCKEVLCYPQLLQTDEHTITHELGFERSDRSSFSDEEALDLLGQLEQFFSFCHGGWLAFAFAVGTNRDGTVDLEEWGVGRIGPPSKPDGFVDPHHLELMVELFPLFMERVSDDDWADAFSHIVYWLRRSDIDNAGPDGGIVLLQAGLERFAWHLLVRELGALSEKGFNDLTAADQLRLLLTNLSIPKAVPDGLTALVKFSKAYGLDGPEAFTRVRNRIVHPPKLKEKRDELPYYDVYRLGRWYAELSVLASCGYTGQHSNRTRKDRWVGQVEAVPWATSKT